MKKIATLIFAGIFFISCAHVVSNHIREKAEKNISNKDIFHDPDFYIGKIIILGGTIVSSKNTEKGTFIEVVERPLNYRGRPLFSDASYGRFLILYEGYLDTAIYSAGREITVAGEILGGQQQALGDMQYNYPLIRSMELHLFEPQRDIPVRFGIGILHTF